MEIRRKATVLVIDDEASVLDIIQDTLLRGGYEVEVATNCKEGMRIFRQRRIDLAIVDIFMPDIDGLETLMEMRRNTGEAKILAISGGGRLRLEEVLPLAEKLGAKGTLPKPFTPEELLEKVAEILVSEA